jgi:hypothetical protein
MGFRNFGLLMVGVLMLAGCGTPAPESGKVLDEARQAGRAASTFPAAD